MLSLPVVGLPVAAGSPAAGRQLDTLVRTARSGSGVGKVNNIAVVTRGYTLTGPSEEFAVEEGDIIIAVGGKEELAAFAELIAPA